MYREVRIPAQQSIGDDACHDDTLKEIFVDLRLERFAETAFQEILGYRVVEELQNLMESSECIQLSQLFDKLHNKDVPRTVLVLRRPGVCKTTLINWVARLWAEGKVGSLDAWVGMFGSVGGNPFTWTVRDL
jgi:hypothetical protein